MSIEENITPSEVRNRLREYLDHNLAQRLQDEEFNKHYSMNRTERGIVGGDVKITKAQQNLEDELAIQQRRLANQTIADSDEALARRIYEEEQERIHNHLRLQLCQDEELAMSISGGQTKTPPSTPSEATLIDLSTPVQNMPHPNDMNNMNSFDSALPSTSARYSLPSYGIPLPGLVGNGTRSRSRTTESFDEPLPAPPQFVFSHDSTIPNQADSLRNTTGAVPLAAWPSTISETNPFYNDVVHAMNMNGSAAGMNNIPSYANLPNTHLPLTPHNSLASASSIFQNNETSSTANAVSSQPTDEFGLPLPSDLALGLVGAHRHRQGN